MVGRSGRRGQTGGRPNNVKDDDVFRATQREVTRNKNAKARQTKAERRKNGK